MKKNQIVLQEGNKDCGSACLLSIIRYYGGDYPLEKLVELTNTTKEGTSFYELKYASQELGLIANGYKIETISQMSKIDKPILAQVNIKGYMHFVVVYKIQNNKCTIMDPAKGKDIVPIEKFNTIFTGNILLIEPYKKLEIHKSDNYIKNIIVLLFIKNKKLIKNLILLSLISTALTCLYSFYFKIAIDNIALTHNLKLIALIFFIIMLIKETTGYFRNKLLIYLNQKVDLSIFLETYNKILSLPYNYYKTKSTGEVISRVNDLGEIKNFLSKILVVIFLDILITISGGIILYIISPKLFLYLILVVLAYILIYKIFKQSIKKLTTICQEKTANVNSLLVETISGFESIKELNYHQGIEKKMEKTYIDALEKTVALDKISNIEAFIKNIVTETGLLLVMFLGCSQILEGNLTLGSLITFNSLLVYFLSPVRNIVDTSKEYFYVASSIKRANNFLNVEPEKLNEETNLVPQGDINIQNLTFKYSRTTEVLKNINLNIKSGEKTLIMGTSGTGKSTLLKIIYAYYKIKRGTIKIGNIDINDYETQDIRKNIGYISQNETLFTDTIKNNIILDRNINQKKFLDICKITGVEEIVQDMPLGYDTPLEEGGVNISGGQRQRIILARMLLKECQILMIDEALNQLDINAERKILKKLFKFYQAKTIIVISHRKDNMDLYDKVVKIENGQIVEELTRNNQEEILCKKK